MADLNVINSASDLIKLAVSKASPKQTIIPKTKPTPQPKIEVISVPPQVANQTIQMAPSTVYNLEGVYADVGGTIWNKRTNTYFRTPEEFFNESGLKSFNNVVFDTQWRPLGKGLPAEYKETVQLPSLNLATKTSTPETKTPDILDLPYEFSKEVAQSMARAYGSAALTAAQILDMTTGGMNKIPSKVKTGENRLLSSVFGKQGVKSIPLRYQQNVPKYGLATGPLLALSTFLDFTGFGEGNAIKRLAKLTDVEEITDVLRKIKMPEEMITKAAARIAKTKNEKEVKQILAEFTQTGVTPKLKTGITNTIADEAIKFAKANPDSGLLAKSFRDPKTKELLGGPRLFKRIGDLLKSGDINIESLPSIVEKYKGVLTNEQIGTLFTDAATYAGRTLNAISRVEKELRLLIPDLELAARPLTGWEVTKNIYLAIDNTRRRLLVTQFATAMRNAISQGGRYTLGTATDALNGVIKTITGKDAAFAPFLEDIAALLRRMSKSHRSRLQEIMAEYPIEAARLYNTPVGDVALGNKISDALNFFNRTQEYYYRNLILDARLHAAADLKKIPIEKLEMDDIIKAVDEALEWTFSKSPESGTFGKGLMNVWREMPIFTLVNPFPRFMSNAVKFLYDYSPLGILSLVRPTTRAAIADGDYNAISKMILGTTMLGAALTVRANPDIAGERWYEIKIGNKTWDTRAFAPFSTYLFLAEFMLNGGKNISGSDWAQAIIGINRVAGTGLALVDLIDSKLTEDGAKKIFDKLFSAYIGGFTVPFVTIKDIIGQWRLEESQIRDTAAVPVIGGAMGNVPGLVELLPTKYSFLEDKPLMREQPLLRQTTGMTITTKPFIQKELDRMNKQLNDFLPKTGNLTANRILIRQTGIILDQWNGLFENSSAYKILPDDKKLELISKVITEAKKEAKGDVVADLAKIVYDELKKVSPSEREKTLKQLSNRGLFTENIQEYFLQMLKAQPLPK